MTLNRILPFLFVYKQQTIVIRKKVYKCSSGDVFKWLLRLLIGLKISRQIFNHREGKQKPIAICTSDFSRAFCMSKLQVVAENSDWFIALFVPLVIGRSDYFGIGFSALISVIFFIIT